MIDIETADEVKFLSLVSAFLNYSLSFYEVCSYQIGKYLQFLRMIG